MSLLFGKNDIYLNLNYCNVMNLTGLLRWIQNDESYIKYLRLFIRWRMIKELMLLLAANPMVPLAKSQASCLLPSLSGAFQHLSHSSIYTHYYLRCHLLIKKGKHSHIHSHTGGYAFWERESLTHWLQGLKVEPLISGQSPGCVTAVSTCKLIRAPIPFSSCIL